MIHISILYIQNKCTSVPDVCIICIILTGKTDVSCIRRGAIGQLALYVCSVHLGSIWLWSMQCKYVNAYFIRCTHGACCDNKLISGDIQISHWCWVLCRPLAPMIILIQIAQWRCCWDTHLIIPCPAIITGIMVQYTKSLVFCIIDLIPVGLCRL